MLLRFAGLLQTAFHGRRHPYYKPFDIEMHFEPFLYGSCFASVLYFLLFIILNMAFTNMSLKTEGQINMKALNKKKKTLYNTILVLILIAVFALLTAASQSMEKIRFERFCLTILQAIPPLPRKC